MAPSSPKLERHLELDSLGILRQTSLPATLDWLQDSDKQLLLDLLFAGADGLSRSYVLKWDKKHKECSLRVTTRSLADWETDKKGQPALLTLNWKGEEVAKLLLQVAKNESQPNRYRKPTSPPTPATPV